MRLPWQRQPDAVQSEFVRIPDAEALGAFFASPMRPPTVLLIHDPWCPISARAYRQAAAVGGSIHLILTGDGQHLSVQVEAATGVRHESPQVFVFDDGHVRWHASHGRVTRDAIRAALESVGQADQR